MLLGCVYLPLSSFLSLVCLLLQQLLQDAHVQLQLLLLLSGQTLHLEPQTLIQLPTPGLLVLKLLPLLPLLLQLLHLLLLQLQHTGNCGVRIIAETLNLHCEYGESESDRETRLLLPQLLLPLSLLLGCFRLTPEDAELLRVPPLLPLLPLPLLLLLGSVISLPQLVEQLLLLLPQQLLLLSAPQLSGSLLAHLLLPAPALDVPQLLALLPARRRNHSSQHLYVQ